MNIPEFFQGGIGLFVGAFLVTLAGFWVVFPLIVWSKLRAILSVLQSIERKQGEHTDAKRAE
jgi:hypothetical protein